MTLFFDPQENDGDDDESTKYEEQLQQNVPSHSLCMIVGRQGGTTIATTRKRNGVRFNETPTIYEYDKVAECEKALVWYNRREEELMHRQGGDCTRLPWDEWIRFSRRRRCSNSNKKKHYNDMFIRACIMLGILWIVFDSLTPTTTSKMQPINVHPQIVKLGSEDGLLDVAEDVLPSSKKVEL